MHPSKQVLHTVFDVSLLTSMYSQIETCIAMAPNKVTKHQDTPKKGSAKSPLNETNLLFLWLAVHNNKGNGVSIKIRLFFASYTNPVTPSLITRLLPRK